jgi:dTDP-4-dehydrorhamnose reductase
VTTILLIGRTGQVGWELERLLPAAGRVVALDRAQLDLTSGDAIRKTICAAAPDVIVNAAGYTAVDNAEREGELAMRVNGIAPGVMAEEARRIDALLVHYSTDYVYDGGKGAPYVEDDAPSPLNTYGSSKLEGERTIVATGCAHLILRTSWIYSSRGSNFVRTILRLARERKELLVVDDQIGSPTWARALAQSTSDILTNLAKARENAGIYHLSAHGYPSRFDFATKIIDTARTLSGEPEGWAAVRRTTTADYPLPAARPLHVATSKEKIRRVLGVEMADWETQLAHFLGEIHSTAGRRE